jgi:cytidylate kinase
LADLLQASLPQGARPWTVFDRSLVEAVLHDHNLPARLASFMPEDKVGQLNDIIEDLFSIHPPTETLVRQTAETILRLAQLGNVIIVGRGGNVITARLPGVLHIRLVGSVESRAALLQNYDHIDKKTALERIAREDGGRRRYFKEYFGRDIDDPLLYHFIINTGWVAWEDAARTIAAYALNHTAPRAGNLPPAPSKAG